MRLKDEPNAGEEGNSQEFYKTFESYRNKAEYKDYFWMPPDPSTEPSFPILGPVGGDGARGKIVVMSEFTLGSEYYGPKFNTGYPYTQDKYEVTGWQIDLKWDYVEKHLQDTKNGPLDKLYVNFLSAVAKLPFTCLGPFPVEVACGALDCLAKEYTGVNELALKYLFDTYSGTRTGALMMDFPGGGLVGAIIAHNMRFAPMPESLSDPGFITDFNWMFDNVAYSAHGWGSERSTQLKEFLVRMVPHQKWHVIVAKKGTFGFKVRNDDPKQGLYGRSEPIDGYEHVAVSSTGCSAGVTSGTLKSKVEPWITNGRYSGSASARADELWKDLRDAFPGHVWNVFVQKGEGTSFGVQRCYGAAYASDWRDDHQYVVWGYSLFNRPPVADAGPDQTVDEGALVTLSGSFTDPDAGDTHTFLWHLKSSTNGQAIPDSSTQDLSFTPNDNGEYKFSFTVTDSYSASDSDEVVVTVNNVAPTVTATGDTIDENEYASVSGTITDPGSQDTFTVTIDWGEGDLPETFPIYPAGTTTYSETHQYLDDNPPGTASDDYEINVHVEDDDGGTGSAEATVTVNNVPPSATAVGGTIDENGVATVSGTISDPGSEDTFSVGIDWDGEGPDPMEWFPYPAGATSYSETHQYLDDDPSGTSSDDYAVLVNVIDDDLGGVGVGTTVTVNNLDPVASIDGITDETGAEIGTDVDVAVTHTAVDVAASFTDVGTLDTHTATIDWGDGDVDVLDPVTSPMSAAHVYADPCDCTITLTITDDDTGADTVTTQIRVVDAAGAINNVIDDLLPDSGDRDVADAIAKLRGGNGGRASNGALDMLEKDDPNAALAKVRQALGYIQEAEAADPSLNFRHEKGLLALAAKSVTVAAIEEAEAVAAKGNDLRRIQEAKDLVAEGDARLALSDYVAAVGIYQMGVREVQGIR